MLAEPEEIIFIGKDRLATLSDSMLVIARQILYTQAIEVGVEMNKATIFRSPSTVKIFRELRDFSLHSAKKARSRCHCLMRSGALVLECSRINLGSVGSSNFDKPKDG
jgi:hypothetical protein